jgi:hypothetical protein
VGRDIVMPMSPGSPTRGATPPNKNHTGESHTLAIRPFLDNRARLILDAAPS